MSLVIADVSHHNVVDFFDKNEIDGVIIRASYGSFTDDRKLNEHVEKAEKAGIPYGFYHFSYAASYEEAKTNAMNLVTSIKKFNPTLPCFIDMERDEKDLDLRINFFPKYKNKFVEIAKTELSILENAGYYAGLYGNEYDLLNITSTEELRNRYCLWVANWTEKPENFPSMVLWQNTNKGRVNGIQGNVDLSIAEESFLGLVDKMEKKNAPIVNGCLVTCTAQTDIYGTHLADFVRQVPLHVMRIGKKGEVAVSADGKTCTAIVSAETVKRYY